jgi:transcription-repair coupling factor (superfamily II helicase)
VSLKESQQVRLQRLYPKAVLKQAAGILLVPVPKTKPLGGRPLRDLELLRWCGELVDAMFLEPARAAGNPG